MDKIKRRFKELGETTSIQGISEAFRARTVKGMIFWIVLVLATNGLTAYQVLLAVSQYQNQPTSTQIEVLEKGNLFYPTVKLCYWPWIHWVNFTKVDMLGIDKQTLLQAMSFLDEIYTEDDLNFQKAERDFQHLISTNDYKSLEQFYHSIAKKNPPGFDFSSESLTFDSASSIKGKFYCYSTNINNYNEVSESVLFSPEVYNKLLGNNKPQKMEIRLIFKSTQLDEKIKAYINDAEYTAYIKSFLKQISTPKGIAETYLLETEELFKNGFEFNAPYSFMLLDSGETTTLLPVTDQYEVQIGVDVHRWLDKPSSRCIEGKQSYPFDYSCFNKCAHVTAPMCNCEKKFWKLLDKNNSLEDLCRHEIFSFNETIIYTQNPSYNMQIDSNTTCPVEKLKSLFLTCLPQCQIKGCEVWRLDITKNELPFFSDHFVSQSHFVSIKLCYPLEDNIFVVKEVESAQWYDIISNIGGLLGIWMGASILSYVHVIYVLCDCDGVDNVIGNRVSVSRSGIGNMSEDERQKQEVKDNVDDKH